MTTTAEINHARTFLHECTLLLDYSNMFNSLISAINDDYSYFAEVNFTSIVFTGSTLTLYRLFFKKLDEYINSRPYSRNQVFVFIDDEWHKIRVDYLIPFIESAESDFRFKQIDYNSILDQIDLAYRPTDSVILNEVAKLYSVLLKKSI